jgi:cation diffusion facilitator CzcD-associated flavoprotein CzcO
MPSSVRFYSIVIGAGFSGLYALHRLRQLGIPALILEKAESVGGMPRRPTSAAWKSSVWSTAGSPKSGIAATSKGFGSD